MTAGRVPRPGACGRQPVRKTTTNPLIPWWRARRYICRRMATSDLVTTPHASTAGTEKRRNPETGQTYPVARANSSDGAPHVAPRSPESLAGKVLGPTGAAPVGPIEDEDSRARAY